MGPFRVSRVADLIPIAVAAIVALIVAVILIKQPLLAIVVVGTPLLVQLLGIESLIALCVLGATGLLPFVAAESTVSGRIKVYFFFFILAVGAMLAAYAWRRGAGRPTWPFPANALSVGLIALLAYVGVVAVGSHPNEVPSLTFPFVIFPAMALATIIWLSHEDALTGLQRALPLIILVVVAWALAYDAGSAGCAPCQHWVSTSMTKEGLLGPDSRLYTAGQNSFLCFTLLAFAFALARPRPLSLSLAALAAVTVGLQYSRAQYIAVAAGLLVLLAWKFGQLRFGGRSALLGLTVVAVIVLLSSPVGHKVLSIYSETSQGTGTGTYRLGLIKATASNWTFFGHGFSTRTLERGFDVDLGLPNTLLVLGYLGGIVQLLLLGIGAWRGIMAKSAAGATIAAVIMMVLVGRPSLPLIEYGHSAVIYGAVLGFAAALRLAPNRLRILRPALAA